MMKIAGQVDDEMKKAIAKAYLMIQVRKDWVHLLGRCADGCCPTPPAGPPPPR